jgi:hypothetical protein
MDSRGSTLFALTWKERVTPLGRRICALRGAALRTSGSGSTSWPSPPVNDSTGSEYQVSRGKKVLKLTGVAKTSWPSPIAEDSQSRSSNETLLDAARSAWPTPQHRENGGGEYSDPAKALARMESGHQINLQDVAKLASWPTPRAYIHSEDVSVPGLTSLDVVARGLYPEKARYWPGQSLESPWVTPSARDWKDSPGMATTGINPDGTERSRIDMLPRQAAQTSGNPVNGSPARTVNRGQLNPALPRWLQSIPAVWDECSPEWSAWLAATESAD